MAYEQSMPVTEGVAVEIAGKKVKVSGPKGNLEREFPVKDLKIEKVENKVKVSSESDRKTQRAIVGATLAHIRNMMTGVTKGYTYKLKILFSHFPMTVKLEKDKVVIQNFLGERKPRVAEIMGKAQVKIDGQDITVTGIDIDEVSQTAGRLELSTRISGYDRKTFEDGIWLCSKG